ncbi:hypothetical protein PIB30_058791 [Stylosanthes scabra]|uniref:Uncharacterized protein n=1 Tax=Stylosanthes scabra TaxID=79078 RepID=A0ABU6WII9_9FABA|nr:hypothetical protein [Stylosanthes scabra]
MKEFMEQWKGPRRVEGRDMGPHKCVLSFMSTTVRNEALKDPFLLSLFLELKPQWGYTRSDEKKINIAKYGGTDDILLIEANRFIKKKKGKTRNNAEEEKVQEDEDNRVEGRGQVDGFNGGE